MLRRITLKRKTILKLGKPQKLARYEDWLPHADYHIFSLFSNQYFDYAYMTSDEKIEKFFTVLNKNFDKRYADLVVRIGEFLSSRQKETGYSHPRYFKTELSWHEIQSVMGNLIQN